MQRRERVFTNAKRGRKRCPDAPDSSSAAKPIPDEASVGSLAQREPCLLPQVGASVSADSDSVDVTSLDPGDVEATTYGIAWKASDVLDSLKTLLLESGDNRSFLEKDRGNVGVIRVDAQDVHAGRSYRAVAALNILASACPI